MPLPKQTTAHEIDRPHVAAADPELNLDGRSYSAAERHARELQRQLHAAYNADEPSSDKRYRNDGRSPLGRIVSIRPVALAITAVLFVASIFSALLLVPVALVIKATRRKANPAM